MTNSIQKGKRGELQVVKLLQEYGYEAQRGQQYKGTPDSPDVIHNISYLHIEVKFRQAFNLYGAVEKTKEDGGKDDSPVVFHRKKEKPWLITMYARDFLEITLEAGR